MLKFKEPWSFAYRGIDVKHFETGDTVPDDDPCAAVAKAEKKVEHVPDPDPGGDADKPTGDDLTAAIRAAVSQLDPDEDFTNRGLPQTDALQRVLGYPVSAAERAAAMAD